MLIVRPRNHVVGPILATCMPWSDRKWLMQNEKVVSICHEKRRNRSLITQLAMKRGEIVGPQLGEQRKGTSGILVATLGRPIMAKFKWWVWIYPPIKISIIGYCYPSNRRF